MKNNDVEISQVGINYAIIAIMFAGIIAFSAMNMYEPQIDDQPDIFELIFYISQFVAGVFGVFVAKKYWGSKVFGKAYLALGVGFILAGSGSLLFVYYEMHEIVNPFPGWPDLLIGPYFLLLLYHLFSCTRYFKKKFTRNDKIIVILIPLSTVITFIMITSIPTYIPGSTPELLSEHIVIDDTLFKLVETDSSSTKYQQVTVNDVTYNLIPIEFSTTNYEQIPETEFPIKFIPIVFSNMVIGEFQEYDGDYWLGYGLTVFYISITSLNLGFAIIGAKIFHRTVLGTAWSLLTVGICLIAIGDIIYYFNAIYSYDKTLDLPFWVFGHFVVAYALYIHKKNL